ncbi:MAG TPA: hypothetical protein VI981_05740 [Candidatus Paceibacterota bacterium]
MINIKSVFKFWKDKGGKNQIHVSKDPVCGMRSTEGIDFIHRSVKYSFCSDHCRQRFEKNPEIYITK